MKYTLSFTLEKNSEFSANKSLSFEQKLKLAKSILLEYDVFDEIGEFNENDNYIDTRIDSTGTEVEVEYQSILVEFVSHLSIFNFDNSAVSEDGVPFLSENLLVYFTQKGGIFKELGKVFIEKNSDRTFDINIYCEDNEVDLDATLEFDTFDYVIS